MENPAIAASLSPLTDIESLGRKWRQLEMRSSCSFFQSWTWIGTWLKNLPQTVELFVLEVVAGDDLVGLAVLGSRTLVRHRIVRSRALLLHETGDQEIDRITIEYNSILAERGREREVVAAGGDCIKAASIDWDELIVSGVDAQVFDEWQAAARSMNRRIVVRKELGARFVDLESVRNRDGNYLSLLSSNTRQQVRRAIKAYEKKGDLALSVASSVESASDYLVGLQELHEVHWNAKGEQGAFSGSFAREFHQKLLQNAVIGTDVQLIRVTAGDEIVGYLYNFVRDGHVYFYQSGLKYLDDSKAKPGLVCHYLAIMHNLEIGNRIYDFMAGSQRYKKSLGQEESEMYWLTIQQPRLRFTIERLFKSAKSVVHADEH